MMVLDESQGVTRSILEDAYRQMTAAQEAMRLQMDCTAAALRMVRYVADEMSPPPVQAG